MDPEAHANPEVPKRFSEMLAEFDLIHLLFSRVAASSDEAVEKLQSQRQVAVSVRHMGFVAKNWPQSHRLL